MSLNNSRLSRRIIPSLLVILLGLNLVQCSGPNDGLNSGTTPPPGPENPPTPPAPTPTPTPTPAPAGPASTRSLFVAENGNDASGNGSFELPYRSLAQAVSVVQPGQTIEMRAGQNYCGTTISRPGSAGAWITLRAYSNEAVRIVPCGRADSIYFYRDGFGPLYWVMQGLEVQGGSGYTVKIDTPHVHLINNNLHSAALDIVKVVGTANDVIIFGNEIHHNIAANGANAQGIDIVGADRTWVAYNYVHDIPSIGMYAKGNARNTVFEHNRVENIYERGIMLGQSTDLALMTDGPYEAYDGIIRNNIVRNTGSACLASASAFNIKIYNNSCYNAATRAHGAIFLSNEAETGQAGSNIDIRNNILYVSNTATRPAVFIGSNALADETTLTLARNLYWSTSAPTFTWEGRTQPLYNVSLADWRQATGKDADSMAADPLYADTASLALQSTSPAIDTGVNIAVVTMDYRGAARPFGPATDIGAYEYGAALPTNGAYTMPAPGAASTLFRYPYLQSESPNRVRIRWATLSTVVSGTTLAPAGNPMVRLRMRGDTAITHVVATSQAFAPATTGLTNAFYQHEAILTGLGASTEYVYDVVYNGAVLAQGVPFKTLSAGTDPVNFIVVGDSGTEWEVPRYIRDAIVSTNTDGSYVYPHDFVIGVGDIAYYDGTYSDFNRKFFDQLSGRYEGNGRVSLLATRPFFPALGNHEYDQLSTGTPQAYLDSFALPVQAGVHEQDRERYYSFETGDAHLVILDSMKFEGDTTLTRLQPMLDWLEADLAATTKTWRMVFFHHTIFSSGDHGTYGDIATNRRLRQQLAPLLQRHGVQLVMFGHDHLYQRSKRMRVDSLGKIVRNTDCSIVESNDGIVYIVSGNGGADLHPDRTNPVVCNSTEYLNNIRDYGDNYDFVALRNGSPMIFHRDTISPANKNGFTQITINGLNATITAYNYSGQVLDQFTMVAR